MTNKHKKTTLKKLLRKSFKTMTQFATVMIIAFVAIELMQLIRENIFTIKPVFAKELLPLTETEYVLGDIPTPSAGKSGQELIKDLVFAVMGYLKVIVASLGIGVIMYSGAKIYMARGDDADITSARKAITYLLIGFVIISMAEDLSKIFDMEKSVLLSSPQDILSRVHVFDKEVEIFVTFIKYIIGAYTTISLVRAGFKMATAGDDEKVIGEERKRIVNSIAGLLLLYIGDIVINKVFYKVNKEAYSGLTGVQPYIDAQEGLNQMIGVTNLLTSIMGTVAVLMLVFGGIMYALSGGKQETMDKAKKIITVTIIGMVIIFAAFAIVSTVIANRMEQLGALNP